MYKIIKWKYLFTNHTNLGVYRIRSEISVTAIKRNRNCCKQSGVETPSFHFTVTMPRIVRTCDTTRMPYERWYSSWQLHYARHVLYRSQERAHALWPCRQIQLRALRNWECVSWRWRISSIFLNIWLFNKAISLIRLMISDKIWKLTDQSILYQDNKILLLLILLLLAQKISENPIVRNDILLLLIVL